LGEFLFVGRLFQKMANLFKVSGHTVGNQYVPFGKKENKIKEKNRK
jgi:hypothetical protein